jgi:hypothetical protein
MALTIRPFVFRRRAIPASAGDPWRNAGVDVTQTAGAQISISGKQKITNSTLRVLTRDECEVTPVLPWISSLTLQPTSELR